MTAQLDQILGYLDREGVTELVLAAGQTMQFRRSGQLVSITAAQLTRTQVAALVANTPLAPLLGQRTTADVTHGKRQLRIESTGTPEAPALKISRAPAPTKPVAASPGAITERSRRPSRAGRATGAQKPVAAPRTKTPDADKARSRNSSKAPRTRGSTKSPPAPTPMPDTFTGTVDLDPPAKIANRLTRSDIKFKPVPSRAKNESLDLDLLSGDAPELDPPTLDLAARAATPAFAAPPAVTAPRSLHVDARTAAPPTATPPAVLSLDLDEDEGIELGAPGAESAPRPRGGALDPLGLSDAGPRSSAPVDSRTPAPGPTHRKSSALDLVLDDSLGDPSPRTPHRGSSQAIDAAFGDPHGLDHRSDKARSLELALPASPRVPTPLELDALGPRVSSAEPARPSSVGPGRHVPAPAAPAAVQPLGAAFSAALPLPAAPAASAAVLSAAPHVAQAAITPSVPSALRELIVDATRRRASDLHLVPGRPPSARVHGELVPVRPEALSASAIEALAMPLLDGRGRAQLDSVGYSDFAFEAPGTGRLRTNVSRCQGGVRATFRIARERPPGLDELGLPKELAKVVSHHQGLVVIAGPSGHGKTTTLAALVDLINAASAFHIITVEDPIEIVYARKAAVVSQREVGAHTRSFAAALKGSLREDPDVIVIGELRDRETVEIALTAAETGHLVLATMSTPSATKTIDRLIDMFPPDDQSQVRVSIAGALRAIVAQRLVPTATGDGVVAAIELLTGVLPLAAMIRDDKLFQVSSLMQRGRAFGMIRLDDSLAELVRAGRISSDSALAVAENRKELAIRLSQGTGAIPVVPPGGRR